MVEPVQILLQLALEPLSELPEVTDEFTVDVLDAPSHFAFILRLRRMHTHSTVDSSTLAKRKANSVRVCYRSYT